MTTSAASALLYGRKLHLEVTPVQSTTTLAYGNFKPSDAALRVAFSIERSLAGEADKAKISVTNMNFTNRAAIGVGTYVALSAGYAGKCGLIFTGFVDKVRSNQQGPDINLEVECSDGSLQLSFATISKTYSEAVSLAQLLQDLAEAMNVTIDGSVFSVAPGIVMGLPNVVFERGITLDGTIAYWLNRLLAPRKLDWCVQNGKLVITPVNATIGVKPCVVLSQSTGMVDTPSFNEKGLVVSSLLNSDLLPGRLLEVQSKDQKASGYYKALTCKYEGDTHGEGWRVEVECEAVDGEVLTLPIATPTNFARAVV